MKVRILNKPVGLATLEREWRRLVSEDDPFWKQYNWFYYWWKSRSEEVNLSVFLVEKGETVIMIAPLVFERKRAGRPVLRFAANDFPNEFIGDVRLAMPVLLKDLFNRNSFDRLWLRHVRQDSDTAKALQAYAENGRILVETANDSPFLLIDKDWPVYEKSLSTNFKRTLRNKRNRLNKQGKVEFHTYNNVGNIGEGLDAAFSAAEKSWQAEKLSAISSPGQREFYRTFSKEAAKAGCLDLHTLVCDDRPIAFEYNLRHGKVVYSLKWGYDASFHAFSPGALLKYEATKQYFQNGYREIDLLGSSDFFKLRWTKTIREDFDYTIFAAGIKNTVEWQLHKSILPMLRSLKHSTGF